MAGGMPSLHSLSGQLKHKYTSTRSHRHIVYCNHIANYCCYKIHCCSMQSFNTLDVYLTSGTGPTQKTIVWCTIPSVTCILFSMSPHGNQSSSNPTYPIYCTVPFVTCIHSHPHLHRPHPYGNQSSSNPAHLMCYTVPCYIHTKIAPW